MENLYSKGIEMAEFRLEKYGKKYPEDIGLGKFYGVTLQRF